VGKANESDRTAYVIWLLLPYDRTEKKDFWIKVDYFFFFFYYYFSLSPRLTVRSIAPTQLLNKSTKIVKDAEIWFTYFGYFFVIRISWTEEYVSIETLPPFQEYLNQNAKRILNRKFSAS